MRKETKGTRRMTDDTMSVTALSIALGLTSTLIGCLSLWIKANASDCHTVDLCWGAIRWSKGPLSPRQSENKPVKLGGEEKV